MVEGTLSSSDLVARRIREARLAAGLTLRQLGDALGVHERTVAGYESSPPRSLPNYDRLGQIAEATGKPVSFFVDQAEAAA